MLSLRERGDWSWRREREKRMRGESRERLLERLRVAVENALRIGTWIFLWAYESYGRTDNIGTLWL